MSTRKPRRPRWVTAQTMQLAHYFAAKHTPEEIASVMGPLREAFTALREGVGTEWNWSIVDSSINGALAIEKQGIVKGLLGHLQAAEVAMQAIHDRAMTSGAWRPTALHYYELDAIATAVDLHEYQIKQLSRGEVRRAIDAAITEVRRAGGQVLDVRTGLSVPRKGQARQGASA